MSLIQQRSIAAAVSDTADSGVVHTASLDDSKAALLDKRTITPSGLGNLVQNAAGAVAGDGARVVDTAANVQDALRGVGSAEASGSVRQGPGSPRAAPAHDGASTSGIKEQYTPRYLWYAKPWRPSTTAPPKPVPKPMPESPPSSPERGHSDNESRGRSSGKTPVRAALDSYRQHAMKLRKIAKSLGVGQGREWKMPPSQGKLKGGTSKKSVESSDESEGSKIRRLWSSLSQDEGPVLGKDSNHLTKARIIRTTTPQEEGEARGITKYELPGKESVPLGGPREYELGEQQIHEVTREHMAIAHQKILDAEKGLRTAKASGKDTDIKEAEVRLREARDMSSELTHAAKTEWGFVNPAYNYPPGYQSTAFESRGPGGIENPFPGRRPKTWGVIGWGSAEHPAEEFAGPQFAGEVLTARPPPCDSSISPCPLTAILKHQEHYLVPEDRLLNRLKRAAEEKAERSAARKRSKGPRGKSTKD